MKNILVTGSLAFDQIMDFQQTFEENIIPEKLKTLSVSFLAQNFSKNFGGVAGNIAYNLGLLKNQPVILSSAGEKDFTQYLKHLETNGVNTKFINTLISQFTANMFMITDKNNCQIAGFFPGAMLKDSKLKIEAVAKKQKIDLVVIAPTMPDAMSNFIKEAKKINIPFLYDPAQQIPRLEAGDIRDGIDGAEILIGNDYELALINKKTGYSKKDILNKVKNLVTTLGEKGSIIETKNRHAELVSASRFVRDSGQARMTNEIPKQVRDDITTFEVGIAKVEKVTDPTGAGDAYIAGFLAGYMKNLPLKTCGQMGATVSSFAIEKYGTQNHTFTTNQFKNRYIQAFKENLDF